MCQEDTQVESLSLNFFRSNNFPEELCHLDLENSNTVSQENSNTVSQEYTGQVQMWFYLSYFQQCLICTLHLCILVLGNY